MKNQNEAVITKETIKVLILSDYKANTGYGTVMMNLVKWLKIYFKNTDDHCGILMDIAAINYFDDMYNEDKWTTVFSALKSTPINKMPETRDDFGRWGFTWILKNSNIDTPGIDDDNSPKGYDLIFILQDAPVINNMVPLLENIKRENKEKNLPNFKSIFYFPADNAMIEPIIDKLGFFDILITYNEYSRKAVLNHRPELKSKLKVIPHGIDLKNFFPITFGDARKQLRKKYFGDNADKFIILNLNRNQPRKDIPCTIFAFIEYKKKNPDAFLYLHMNPQDPMGWDLRLVLMQTNLREGVDFAFPEAEKQNHGYTTEELNEIYNACDVYVTTTLGEGWGLGVTEAMGCMLPVICPMHTSFTEIGDNGNRCYALENLYPICGMDNVIREQCDYLEVAEKFDQVCNDLKKHKHDGEEFSTVHRTTLKALEYVESLHWQGIAYQFGDYIKKLC